MRFFSEDSFWNQPLGADVEADPSSERLIELMDERQGAMYINCERYTIPVYLADASTPLRRIYQRGPDEGATGRQLDRQKRYRQHPDFGPEIPIPADAVPDPDGDAHMAIVDLERRMAWDMWYVRIRPDGEYESATGMVYSLESDGVWRTEDFPIEDGESMHFHGPSRAAGVPAIAGLILEEEIRAGRIAHKLAFASNPACQEFVWPATWTDGAQEEGPREGCIIQLDPELDLDAFDLTPGSRTIARALQEYGAVTVDGAGGNVVYAEGLYGHPGRSWEGVLDPNDLRCIPLRHYRILKMEGVVCKGDGFHAETRRLRSKG
ncbi:MAG: hypothetical protein ACOC2L_04905 [Candidatus Sumerlaeota bacterium]